ncbi:tRNA-specific adenosine deaminase 1 [Lutzomyia longipalpis]|uniref:tRNA-specific adenosine deaminase 1 n=1 Tax=Lutzomyia longipalpis TaxID=7200 RepID=UPI0024834B32|nr:tRNA-specific adenosine deaminase 1 [Lutzomyia longipalpis]
MIANDVVRMCAEFFEKQLPKAGKPLNGREWTVLCAIVKEEGGELEVVAMGTGTKCIGADLMCESGDIVNDSHAEIVTRRAFLRYLMEQMTFARQLKASIFEFTPHGEKKFILRTGCKFHFFTTHSPCGDASIFPGIPTDDEDSQPPAKRPKAQLECQEGGFTGGKLIGQAVGGDLMEQTVGCVRRKPGRGVATLSASCSDKMARWCVLGVQGGLLMNVLAAPVYLDTLIYPRDAICDKKATERALWRRFTNHPDIPSDTYNLHCPEILIATEEVVFPFERHPHPTAQNDEWQPSPGSIVYCRVGERSHEVAIAGKRQGVTKKKAKTPAARLLIAKKALFIHYMTIFPQPNSPQHRDLSYQEAKNKDYRILGQWLKQHYFSVWPTKSEKYLKFTCTN